MITLFFCSAPFSKFYIFFVFMCRTKGLNIYVTSKIKKNKNKNQDLFIYVFFLPCVWIWVKNNTNLTPIGRNWWLLLNILNKMKNIQASFNSSLHSKHKTYLSCVCRLVSVTDETLCIISPLMNGCVQWTVNHATTRRKTKKGYISCIENKLYLSKMQVGKHLLFLSSMRIVTVYASISITHECHRNISVFTVINMTS